MKPENFHGHNANLTKNLIRNRQFFQDVEQLQAVLAPAKRAVQAIEANSSDMASIFLELVKMAAAIKQIPNYLDSDFKEQCISIFNKRWAQFDIDLYLVAFFLHPNYRGKFNHFLFLFIITYLFILIKFI